MDSQKVQTHKTNEHASELSDSLYSAFLEDPVWRYALTPDACDEEAYRKRLRFFMDDIVSTALSDRGRTVVHSSTNRKCVAVWDEIGCWKMTFWQELRFLSRAVFVIPLGTLMHGFTFINALEKRHPSEPHIYLHLL
eukprot:IDg11881t1